MMDIYDGVSQVSPLVKYYIESYGCAANAYDTEAMENLLRLSGFERAFSPYDADIIIINTCIVKKVTEDRMRYRIKALSTLNKPLIVAGCMAEALPNLVKKINPKASLVGPYHIDKITEYVKKALKGETIKAIGKVYLEKPSILLNSDNPSEERVGVIPISQGCLGTCTFCITKFARGHHYSYPPDSIIKLVKKFVEKGVKEIRLTGQDLGPYGTDIKTDLAELLEKICEIRGEFMVRVGMASPNTIYPVLDRLLDVMKECNKIYKFLHIPVQSGSDRILELMKRGHKADLFKEEVKIIRRKLGNDVSIATDIIVAFPGETEEDHYLTLKLLQETRPDVVNVSRYGDRPMTVASKMYPKVHSGLAKKRSAEISRLVRKISLEKNLEFLHNKFDVLILDMDDKRLIGRTKNYKLVYVDDPEGARDFLGEWATVHIRDVTWKALYGTMLINKLNTQVVNKVKEFS